jgi:drug/metabolite transporter (DMT)-like permease
VLLAYAQLAGAMALVGANVAVSKVLAGALPVAVIIAGRCAISCAALLPFVRPRWPGGKAALNLAGQALLGTVLYNAALLAGLRRVGALEAGLVLATLPAVIAVGSWACLGERIGARGWTAAALAAAGMASLAGLRGGMGNLSLAGAALVFLAVCGEAAYVLLARANAGRLGIGEATLWMQAASLAFALPLALAARPAAVPGAGILALLVVHALTASLLAVVLWYAGLRRVPGHVAGVFAAVLPLSAGVVAVLALGETLRPAHAVGAVLVLLSIGLATR